MADQIVEGEIVDPAPEPENGPPPEGAPRGRTFFHPASGAVILAVDWAAFGLELVTGPLALLVMSLLAGVATFYAVLAIQRRFHKDTTQAAVLKAIIAAVAAGVPFPITGTIVGAAIIALSGLPTLGGKLPGKK
jgi:hypothetical protein